jgi:hypothetical protein
MAGSSATSRAVIPQLSKKYRVVAPDLFGHGESAKPRGDYSLGAFAVSLRDLLALGGGLPRPGGQCAQQDTSKLWITHPADWGEQDRIIPVAHGYAAHRQRWWTSLTTSSQRPSGTPT